MPDSSSDNGLRHVAMTDVGLRRSTNQDSMSVMLAGDRAQWAQRGHVFLVADGMGAHAAGELASKLAADGIPLNYSKMLNLAPPDALRKAIVDANVQIHGRGQNEPEFQGMGTTCSVLVLLPQGALVAHVGDSRVYRLRQGKFEQLTFDHSLVWEMEAAGRAGDLQQPLNIPKNIITRSLGPNASVKVDLEGPFALQVGDRFLLCSDGLSGQLSDEELGVVLGTLSLEQAARTLIDLANLRGGPDNITVVLAEVVNEELTRYAGEPFVIPTQTKGPSVHPGVWIALGVCLLGALGMAIMQLLVPAAMALIGAFVAGAVAWIQSSGGSRLRGYRLAEGQLGSGPHRSCDATPRPEIVAGLAKIADDLRGAADREHWDIDWARLNSLLHSATTAATAGDHAGAVKHYCLAITTVMQRARQRQN